MVLTLLTMSMSTLCFVAGTLAGNLRKVTEGRLIKEVP